MVRACATRHQIKGLREMAGNDVTKTPGYDRLSLESQEQLKLAFEDGRVAGKDFKDIRSDLAGSAPSSGAREIRDAEGYKVDMPVRPAGCRVSECENKVVRGELRVGFLRNFDGEHMSWVYKHWHVVQRAPAPSLVTPFDCTHPKSYHWSIPMFFSTAFARALVLSLCSVLTWPGTASQSMISAPCNHATNETALRASRA
jgi:hypothetical protein